MIILIFGLFLLLPKTASAQVVINEFSSWETNGDWIELYSPEEIDISEWIIRDSASSVVKTIPATTIIGNENDQFYTIDVGNRLNRDKDHIKLLKSDDITIVDEIIYGEANAVCAPNTNESVGRYPDANSTYERFSTATKDLSNNTAELNPCPAPTSEPTQKPSPTEKPEPTAKPTSTPRPLNTTKPLPTAKLSPTTVNLISEKAIISEIIPSEVSGFDSSEEADLALGIKDMITQKPDPSSQVLGEKTGKVPYQAIIFSVSGLLFLLMAFYPLLKNKIHLKIHKNENN